MIFLLFANLCSLYLRWMYLEQGHDGENHTTPPVTSAHALLPVAAGIRILRKEEKQISSWKMNDGGSGIVRSGVTGCRGRLLGLRGRCRPCRVVIPSCGSNRMFYLVSMDIRL